MDHSHAPKLIAFTGWKGCGKSSAAKALWPTHVKVSFADPLRTMLIASGICTVAQMVDPVSKETPIEWLDDVTPRFILQTLGTEWGRDTICKEIWVRLGERTIQNRLGNGIGVVVDDVRFKEEAEVIKRLGGIVVQITREGIDRTSGHSSENPLDPKYIDRIIHHPAELAEHVCQERIRDLVYSFNGNPPQL